MITLCVYRDVSGMFTTESRLGGVRDELGGRGGPEAEGQGAETRCVRAAGRGGCKDQVCEGSEVDGKDHKVSPWAELPWKWGTC